MQLEVAPRALDDLKKIAGYIQLDKPGTAIRFVERIWREFDVIANHPMIFPAADGARVGFRLGRVATTSSFIVSPKRGCG